MPGTLLNAEKTMLAKNTQYTPCSHGIYQLVGCTETLWIRLKGGGHIQAVMGTEKWVLNPVLTSSFYKGMSK